MGRNKYSHMHVRILWLAYCGPSSAPHYLALWNACKGLKKGLMNKTANIFVLLKTFAVYCRFLPSQTTSVCWACIYQLSLSHTDEPVALVCFVGWQHFVVMCGCHCSVTQWEALRLSFQSGASAVCCLSSNYGDDYVLWHWTSFKP